ncbi:MAG TPA: T9SS type A sorting domain-containing protein [Puia sp.]|nr:T9SS type A sorting domain-containing protein [Puia sp.]
MIKSYIPIVCKRVVCLALLGGIVCSQTTKAQNAGNLATRTYDTALTSDGFGIFHIQFPQFNPDFGTLVSVHISAQTNTMYGFTLRDADSIAANYALTVGIQDEFSGPALPATYSNVTNQSLGNFPLTAGAEVTQAPVSLLQNHVSTDTVTAINPFLGDGNVSLRYQAFTFTNLNSANNAAYYYSAGITNTMTFSVQYQYNKTGGILATDLTGWSATPLGLRDVQLSWAATNETAGREYVIQRGADAAGFQDIATVPATADGTTAQYHYPDELPLNAGNSTPNSWYYRLQIRDATGQVTYSPIREVKLDGTSATAQIYPNPATTFINFVPDVTDVTDWQVDILSASGALVQRSTFMQTKMMTVNFQSKLPAGTYFVHAIDLRGQRSISTTFLVP